MAFLIKGEQRTISNQFLTLQKYKFITYGYFDVTKGVIQLSVRLGRFGRAARCLWDFFPLNYSNDALKLFRRLLTKTP